MKRASNGRSRSTSSTYKYIASHLSRAPLLPALAAPSPPRRHLAPSLYPAAQERAGPAHLQDGAAERHRPAEPAGGAREAQAQEEAPRPVPQLLLHGCQVPGLLQHNNCFQPLSDRGGVPRLPDCSLPTNWWEGQAH